MGRGGVGVNVLLLLPLLLLLLIIDDGAVGGRRGIARLPIDL